MATTDNVPINTSSNPRHSFDKTFSAKEAKLDDLETKLDQAIELLKQLVLQDDQKQRTPSG